MKIDVIVVVFYSFLDAVVVAAAFANSITVAIAVVRAVYRQ